MIPNITPLSPGPNRATMNSDQYVEAADVTMSELPAMVDEQNDAIDAMNLVAIQTPPATPADILAGVTTQGAYTPGAVSEAIEWVALADGATVTPDGLDGRNFTWAIGGNRSLEAIVNCKVNQVYHLWITQAGAGGHDLAWDDDVYQRTGGLPVLPQDPGDEAHLQLKVLAADGLGVATQVLATYSPAPTGV
ncbi:MAG: hypothetical protein U1C74_20700 [Phenylobacterium sp.]|nr:hypothetical protein [Phenylobacterium sp.]